MQEIASRTTGVIMIDDPKPNVNFNEFLLQAQGRLMSGSNKVGMTSIKAATLISTNSPEVSRLVGRVIRFNYVSWNKERNEQAKFNDKQLKVMREFMQENKGILLVWAIKYLELWAEVFEHAREIVEEVVQAIFDENDLKVQARWLSGIAAVLVANALLRLSCGNQANTKDYVLFACGELLKVQTVSIRSTMQRLEAYIIEKIAEEKDRILTWLHPKVTVNNIEGMKVPGIALLSTAVDSFVDISHTEFKELQSTLVREPGTIGIYFGKDRECTLEQMIKRNTFARKERTEFLWGN
ncbi:uncharacterized protein LOC114516672 isoform X1 [Dendronephthya gigantea]|uniref:uncharacterized protein LOC114516672 isoform X1 n=1 Tax=Dendronephthya gigantea TaxID=151771 RepID=UPI0010699895|nr:uncharacterized protein LOC114516672 isoform X1 [Dendronephthya gigantea]